MTERPGGGAEESSYAGDGLGSALLDLYRAPRRGFARLLARRSVWLPLGLLVALNVAFAAWWVPRADVRGIYRAALEEQGLWEKLDDEQREGALVQEQGTFPYVAYASAVLTSPIVALAMSGFFLLVYRRFYRTAVTFRDCLVVTTWTLLAVALVRLPAVVVAMLIKNDWVLSPDQALQLSPAAFFTPGALSPALGTLFAGLDLFLLLTLFLLVLGFAVAAKRPTRSAAWGIAIPYALVLLVSVGLRLLMSAEP